MMDMESHFFVCDCYSDEHTLRFTYDPEDNDLWAGVYLDRKRWFVRLWVALKYVFGYQCKYGAFDCYIDGSTTTRIGNTNIEEAIKKNALITEDV